ncbi:MAG: diadenylate cyclase [Puniceicoccaceae bacterium]
MRLDRFITRNRILEIKSTGLAEALRELIGSIDIEEVRQIGQDKLLNLLLDRERTMTSYLGGGVALPHIRLPLKSRYIIAVGRVPSGLSYDGPNDYGQVRIIFLLLAAENVRGYLNTLATIAGIFQDGTAARELSLEPDLTAFQKRLFSLFSGGQEQQAPAPSRINRLMLRETERIARALKCRSVVIFGDTFAGGLEIGTSLRDFNTILITRGGSELTDTGGSINQTIPVRSYSHNRMSQLRAAILIGLTRGIFNSDEQICCIGGLPQSNRFDTVLIVDVKREFHTLIADRSFTLPSAIRPEVLERVLAIATELGMEGREGKRVGALYVLGDTNHVLEHSKQLVLNPFFGYKEEDRNVLNPFMDETVKEFSSIDGAFIIRGNGVIEAAGALLRAPEYPESLPSGLGARHAAGASITLSTKSIALVVSSSTGQVSLFSKGNMISILSNPLGNSL